MVAGVVGSVDVVGVLPNLKVGVVPNLEFHS